MARFFDYDGMTGQAEFFHYNEENGAMTIETRQDVEPILNANKRAMNDGDGYTPSRDMKRIASIPLNIVELWKEKYGIDLFNKNHAQGVRRLLNDPDWRYLRTSGGIF